MFGPGAAGSVVDPLAVDVEAVEAVGGNADEGGFEGGEAEGFFGDDGVVVDVVNSAFFPDPFGFEFHDIRFL